jgi:hypothetical protein
MEVTLLPRTAELPNIISGLSRNLWCFRFLLKIRASAVFLLLRVRNYARRWGVAQQYNFHIKFPINWENGSNI